MALYLGADGGGTKTAFALLDGDGHLLAQASAPSSYYFSEGLELVPRVLAEGVAAVCAGAGAEPGDVRRAFFGLPSYGEVSADVAALDAAPAAALGHDRYDCDNDMVCAWAGSLAGADGINVIAGTGSMTYGQLAGRGVRVGGWGELFGDEGSAHWLAREGLQLASRQADGRAETGPLLALLREHLDLAADLDLVDVVLNRWRSDRGRVAALAPVVVRAARAGDAGCTDLLARAADELVALVTATARQLGADPDDEVAVSRSGGVFRAAEVLDGFTAGLARAGRFALREPAHSPVVGAALHAARRDGAPLGPDALARLREADPPPAPEPLDGTTP